MLTFFVLIASARVFFFEIVKQDCKQERIDAGLSSYGEVQSYGVLQNQRELHVCLFLPFCVIK